MNIEDLPNPLNSWSPADMDQVYNTFKLRGTYDAVKLALHIVFEEPKPKPCPFCGSTACKEGKSWEGIICLNCRAKGPIELDEQSSIIRWNKRIKL